MPRMFQLVRRAPKLPCTGCSSRVSFKGCSGSFGTVALRGRWTGVDAAGQEPKILFTFLQMRTHHDDSSFCSNPIKPTHDHPLFRWKIFRRTLLIQGPPVLELIVCLSSSMSCKEFSAEKKMTQGLCVSRGIGLVCWTLAGRNSRMFVASSSVQERNAETGGRERYGATFAHGRLRARQLFRQWNSAPIRLR